MLTGILQRMKKGFSLSEILITMAIIGIIAAVTLPMTTQRRQIQDVDSNLSTCVKTELAANMNSAACVNSIAKAQSGVTNVLNGMKYLINTGSVAENRASRKVAAAACNSGGEKACALLVQICQKDDALCDVVYGRPDTDIYDVKYYLDLPVSANNNSARFIIAEYMQNLYNANNVNIKTIADNRSCQNGYNFAAYVVGHDSLLDCDNILTFANQYGGPNRDGADEYFDTSIDMAGSIAISPDGNYAYLAGSQNSSSAGTNYWTYLMKVRTVDGVVVWKNSYDGMTSVRDIALSPDGKSIYISGGSAGLTVMKISSHGQFEWLKRYTATAAGQADMAKAIAVSPDGSRLYVVGYIYPDGNTNYDMAVMKLNSSTGAVVWRRYLDYANANDLGKGIVVSPDESFVYVAGTINNGADAAVIKLIDTDDISGGVISWARSYSGASTEDVHDLAIDSGNNIYLLGGTNSFNAYTAFLTKIDDGGALIWTYSYGRGAVIGGVDPSWDMGYSLAVATNNTVYITGFTDAGGAGALGSNDDIFVLGLNNDGTIAWERSFGGLGNEYGSGVALSPDEINLFVAGIESSDADGGVYDIALLKLKTAMSTSTTITNWDARAVAIPNENVGFANLVGTNTGQFILTASPYNQATNQASIASFSLEGTTLNAEIITNGAGGWTVGLTDNGNPGI
jgi:prepilin-type N-terminal cleavage/methylation domain-containing protein